MAIAPNSTPKQRFMLSADNITKHRDMIADNTFQRALDFALLQYTTLVTNGQMDGNTAMGAGYRIQGASEFILYLKTLAETAPLPAARNIVGLDHNV